MYLNELNTLLNRLHADFSNDRFLETDMLAECRHEFFRKVMTGKVKSYADLTRKMRLLRSRMDADQPCLLMELTQKDPGIDDDLEGRWEYSQDRLELTLRKMLGGDIRGFHILPTVHPNGEIMVLCCPLHGASVLTGESMSSLLINHVEEGIEHLKEYFGLDLTLQKTRILPALSALCEEAGENK